MKEFNTERMCRINGQRPTARDRWTAFYRLYRLAMGRGAHHDIAAGDCFRILWSNWSMFRLAEGEEQKHLSRVSYPKFIRRQLLNTDRRHRLYSGLWEWMGRDKKIARMLCDRGQETTPDEVATFRRKLIKGIRDKAAIDGVKIPADDGELMDWLHEGWRQRGNA